MRGRFSVPYIYIFPQNDVIDMVNARLEHSVNQWIFPVVIVLENKGQAKGINVASRR